MESLILQLSQPDKKDFAFWSKTINTNSSLKYLLTSPWKICLLRWIGANIFSILLQCIFHCNGKEGYCRMDAFFRCRKLFFWKWDILRGTYFCHPRYLFIDDHLSAAATIFCKRQKRKDLVVCPINWMFDMKSEMELFRSIKKLYQDKSRPICSLNVFVFVIVFVFLFVFVIIFFWSSHVS